MGDQLRPTRERLQEIRDCFHKAFNEMLIGEVLAEVDGLNVEIELWKTRFYASQDTLKRELNSRNAAIAEIKAFADNEMRELQKEIADLNKLLTEPF